MSNHQNDGEKEQLENERYEVLQQLEEWLEWPVLILGFVWLVLLIIELLWGLNPILEIIGYTIWAIFVVDFATRFVLAPHKLTYLRSNWLTTLSLFLPALRVFRITRLTRLLQLSRTVRGLRLVRVVTSLNRGMKALRASMRRRGFGYIVALTLVVVLVGAAGMVAFENEAAAAPGFDSYGEAVWWTAMIMTTLGSEYWPQTAEGRVLTFILSLYSFAVFGYTTATLATFFIGREAASDETEVAGTNAIEALQAEIKALRLEMKVLMDEERADRQALEVNGEPENES
jgi:voltage-gated potassium channel